MCLYILVKMLVEDFSAILGSKCQQTEQLGSHFKKRILCDSIPRCTEFGQTLQDLFFCAA